MNKIDLIKLLRSDFNNHVRNIYIKDECKICGSNIDLHLHHDTTFKSYLEYTLLLLSIENNKRFDNREVELIRNLMLGFQIRNNEYTTLCKECHINKHRRQTKGNNFELNDMWLNKPLTKEDKNKLCKELMLIDKQGRLLKWTSIKAKLLEHRYNIRDTQRRLNGKQTKVSIITKGEL